jgi:hypothetical protein
LRLPIEGRNFGGDLNRKAGRIESFDSADAALTRYESIPKRFASNTQRCDTPHSSDDNTAWTRERFEHASF